MLAMPEQIVIGFDFGMRKIGVALGNVMLQQARPLSTLAAVDGVPQWQEIAKLIQQVFLDFIIAYAELFNSGVSRLSDAAM